MALALEILGFGLTHPFRRDKKLDFASSGGRELIQSAVGQVLGTRGSSEFSQGEVPWRTEFGSLLHLLRHMKNDAVLSELARSDVLNALQRWEPRIVVRSVTTTRETSSNGENILAIRVRFDVIGRNTDANNVVLEGLETKVEV